MCTFTILLSIPIQLYTSYSVCTHTHKIDGARRPCVVQPQRVPPSPMDRSRRKRAGGDIHKVKGEKELWCVRAKKSCDTRVHCALCQGRSPLPLVCRKDKKQTRGPLIRALIQMNEMHFLHKGNLMPAAAKRTGFLKQPGSSTLVLDLTFSNRYSTASSSSLCALWAPFCLRLNSAVMKAS